MYELYEDDDLSINELTRRTKWDSDVLKGSTGEYNGKAVFYSTECAAFALSYYLSGRKLEGSIDNVTKLDAVEALMNWNYDDYSFAYNPEANEQYKTIIMDDGGGASTQNKMIPAIKRLFNKEYVQNQLSTTYMNVMQRDMDNEGNITGGMYYIVTTNHISVPYKYNGNTGAFSCHDCDGSNFTASINEIKFVLLEKK